jgi:hypothetical protein
MLVYLGGFENHGVFPAYGRFQVSRVFPSRVCFCSLWAKRYVRSGNKLTQCTDARR